MSIGAAEDPTLSDEEIAQLRQPPPIVAPEPPPVYGPSPTPPGPSSFIDQVAAGPLPAGASNGTAGDAETAWPPPVPEEAPGMVPPAMPSPPGMQGTTPNMPSSVPGTPDQQLAQANQDVRAAATGAAKARTEADSTQMDALQGGADVAHQRATILGDRRVDMQADQVAQQEAQDRFDEADKKAQEAVDAAANERKNFKFRDYWADKSSANKIGSALAVALGAFGAGLTKGPNYALQILDKSMDDDHRLQVEESQQLSDNEVRARTGLKDVAEARKQDLLNRQMNSALGDKLIATQLEEAAAKSTDANYQKNLNAFAAKLNSDSAQKLLETRAAVRTGLIKEQDDAAKRAEEAARTNLYNAQAAKLGRAGVGVAGTGKAYDAFKAAVLANSPNVGELAEKAKIKPAQIAEQVEKIRTEDDKEAAMRKKAAAGGVDDIDQKRMVRDADGTEAGMANTPRAVPQIQKELKTIPRAIAQLKELRDTKWVSPRDPRFHNAILAVASTTSAGSTDANVAHEKGTLTNALGLPDNDAIDRKLAELENQLAATQAQLEPLPEGYVPRKSVPPGAPGANAQPPAPAPKAAAEHRAGETRSIGGKTYVKTGPNSWELQQ